MVHTSELKSAFGSGSDACQIQACGSYAAHSSVAINFVFLSRFAFAVEGELDARMPSRMQAVLSVFMVKPCKQLLHKETPVAGQSLAVLPTPLGHAQWFSDHVERTFASCSSGGRSMRGHGRTKTIGALTVQCIALVTATAHEGTDFGTIGTGLRSTEVTLALIR